MPRYFTVEEANQALDVIRPLVRELLEIRSGILARKQDLWPMVEKAVGNGGSRAMSEIALEFAQIEKLIQDIQSTGAFMKDVNSGLIDFLAQRDGRDVFLCWRFDELNVQYWHEINAGFAGRQAL